MGLRQDCNNQWIKVIFYPATEHRVLTSKAHEEAEEHWIKEAKTDSENVLMDHSGHCEHKEHGRCSETLIRHLKQQKQREHSNIAHYMIVVSNILYFFNHAKVKKKQPNCTITHPQEVPIHVIVQPVVDYDIPSAIVIGKRG